MLKQSEIKGIALLEVMLVVVILGVRATLAVPKRIGHANALCIIATRLLLALRLAHRASMAGPRGHIDIFSMRFGAGGARGGAVPDADIV
jgi:hypothetical protein